MSYSNSRPIHNLHREIRSTPDEAEPTFSFERESFLASPELEKEDEFLRRLQSNHKHTASGGGGGSFWRSSSAESSQPVFSSAVQHSAVNIRSEAKKNKSAGLLSAALLDGSNTNMSDHANATVSKAVN